MIVGSGNAVLMGPAGHIELKEQVICAQRHIHMSEIDARMLNVINGQKVHVKTEGERSLIFDEVVVPFTTFWFTLFFTALCFICSCLSFRSNILSL